MLRSSRCIQVMARRAMSDANTAAPKATTTVKNTPAPAAPDSVNANVPGLSSKCVKPTTGPVGPGAAANAAYKVPEYFSFDRFSYHEAEVEMAKYRCPQPSALKK